MPELFRDFRHAARTLRRRPGFTATAALTMGLGVAATTALWSVVSATLLRPLPFEDPARLGIIWGVAGPDRDIRGASPIEIADWAAMTTSFEAVALYDQTAPTVSGIGAARQLQAETVGAEYFELLGVQPVLGRTFSEDELRPNGERVVVIAQTLWRDLFGGDPAVLGRTLTIDDRAHTIIGVMPETFRGAGFDTEVWRPIVATVGDADAAADLLTARGNRWLGALARLNPGVTWEAAQADLDRVAADLARAYPESNTERGAMLLPLRAFYLGDTQLLLIVLLGAVGLLFAIAAANVTNLQLVRASGRTSEIALRFALGGGRRHIIRQLVVEGLVLAALGGALGLIGAAWGVQAFLPLVPDGVLPGYADVGVDWTGAFIAIALATLCGTVSAAVPAFRATRRDPARHVVATNRTSTGGLHGRWSLQHALVAAEVALALVVLVGATLMIRSFQAQRAIAPGFDAADVVVARVQLPAAGYDAAARRSFVDRLVAEVAAIPAVREAAVTTAAPLRGFSSAAILQREGHDDDRIRYYRHAVTPGYFDALGIPIERGRAFAPADGAGGEGVVILGAETARRFWPDIDPIGRRIRIGSGPDALATVVGVAADVRMRGLTTSPNDPADDPDVYFAYAQRPAGSFDVVARTAGDVGGAFEAIRNVVARLDPNLAVYALEPLDATLAAQTATDRFGSTLLTIFGALALLLAAVGVYGVMAFYVGTHAREIAIRMAIGAAPGTVRRLVLGRGIGIVAGGVAVGIVAALFASRLLGTLLFGVTTTDVATYAVVTVVLLAVAAMANALPALRATRIPPQVTLRAE